VKKPWKRKNRLKRYRKAAGTADKVSGFIGATKWTPERQRRYDKHRLGKLGAASEVRHIDPKTWKPPADA
jgi:hypothetical protein